MSATRVIRAGNWWYSKLPPLFAIAYALVLMHDTEPVRALVLLGSVLVITGGSVGAYGHVVNDICDLEVDRKIGKPNRMAGLSPLARGGLCLLFLTTTFVPALVVGYGAAAVLLLVVECLLPTLYSVPPVRLKDRGLLGVLADAGGAHTVPALIVLAAFSHPAPIDPVLAAVIAVWSTCVGVKGILWHQGLDREGDLAAGARTFAATAGVGRTRRILTRVVHPLEVASFTAVVVVLGRTAPLLVVLFVVFVAVDLVKYGLGWSYVFDPRDETARRRHLPLISNFFYELWFPLTLAVQVAIRYPLLAVLPLFQLVAFWRNAREQLEDLRTLAGDLWRRSARAVGRRRWQWELDLHGGGRARLKAAPGDGVRVEIADGGSLPWHVKLSRSGLAVRQGTAYEVRFAARADRPRKLTYTAVGGCEPWQCLGLSEEVDLGPAWERIVERFVSSDDDDNACLSVLLGGATTAVELREVVFEEEPPPTGGQEPEP